MFRTSGAKNFIELPEKIGRLVSNRLKWDSARSIRPDNNKLRSMKYLDGLTLIESILLWLLTNKTKLPYHPRNLVKIDRLKIRLRCAIHELIGNLDRA